MNFYQLHGRADKLIEKILDSGGSLYGDYTITTTYLRNNEDITDLQTAVTTINNLYEYDPDFDDEPGCKYECSISSDKMENYYTDLLYSKRLRIIKLPNHLGNVPEHTFITINQYLTEKANIVYHTNKTNKFDDNKTIIRTTKKLSTIKFTDNTEMYGEINSGVNDDINTIGDIVKEFQKFATVSPINPIEDGYIAFKYGKNINEDNFQL